MHLHPLPKLTFLILRVATAVLFGITDASRADQPPAKADPDPKKSHWAFQPVLRPPLPAVKQTGWERNPIDRFILSRLEAAGLTLSKEADRPTLIRRLKFDLLGLPPTPEEVEAFVKDPAHDAYEQLVERYLASPHYGERWARHWLDTVHFAESNGFEMNQPRPNAWRYRDWVIQALNEDKPYDRFVREQLAGDQLGADEATGFLVAGPWDEVKSPDPVLTRQQRADELHDMVSTSSSTFLGLTVGCARCHNHKFDPIPQVDYYRMQAVFAGVTHGDRELQRPDDPKQTAEIATLKKELNQIESELAKLEPVSDPDSKTPRRQAVNARLNVDRFKPVKAKFLRFTVLATNSYEPCIDELEIYTSGDSPKNIALASAGARTRSSGNYTAAPSIHRLEFINDAAYGNSHSWISNERGKGWVEFEFPEAVEIARVVWARDREEKFTDRLAVKYRFETAIVPGEWTTAASSDDRAPFGSPSTAAPPGLDAQEKTAFDRLTKHQAAIRSQFEILKQVPLVYGGQFLAPPETHRLYRGDPMLPKELVTPGSLSAFAVAMKIPEDAGDAERRKSLGEWITNPANPLTARVIVNRLWQYHFGTGIVSTPSDFGLNGALPTHPELLDYLAVELRTKGWRLKEIHRLIVNSATYRQSSQSRPEAIAKDASCSLLWRYPPRRLEAEPLRDAILFISGDLDLTPGGPGFDLFEPNTNYVRVYTPKKEFGPAEFRRMIYQFKPRMQLDDTFGAFDCPDGGQIAPKRNTSTTPLQALNLLNSPFLLQESKSFATRVEKEAGADVEAQVKRAFQLAFQRDPAARELEAAKKLVDGHGLPALCRALYNANEFIYIP